MTTPIKPPERWTDIIANTPSGPLTKKEVFDYYNIPEVQQAILNATKGRDVLIHQNFAPDKEVVRRRGKGKLPIRFETPDDFRKWQRIRMTEIHPTFGEQENSLIADIDPGANVDWEKTKALTKAVADRFAKVVGPENVNVQFSGGRGFHVRGNLSAPKPTGQLRGLSKRLLRDIVKQHENTTLDIPTSPDQTRLDTSTLHPAGSLRAPYSLNAQTGLVSAPITLNDLAEATPNVFSIVQILDKLQKAASDEPEFAPGIPASRKIQPIPEVKKPENWQLAVQLHKAEKAGPHWDLRLVDPAGAAHSFAVPKKHFPSLKDKMLLAIQQPTHTSDYALNFEGDIPEGTYGAGSVKQVVNEPVQVIFSSQGKLRFKRPDGSEFAMFKTKDKNWGLKRVAPTAKKD